MSEEDDAFEDEISRDEIALEPSEAADPRSLVERMIPADLLEKYEVYSYRSAATILSVSHREAFDELCQALRDFSYAFSAFAQTGVIDVGVLVTRGTEMTDFIKALGPALTKSGQIEMKDGKPRTTAAKYGASTTWMGKLLYRLNAGRNGACPVLVFGITPACVAD